MTSEFGRSAKIERNPVGRLATTTWLRDGLRADARYQPARHPIVATLRKKYAATPPNATQARDGNDTGMITSK